MNAPHLTCPDPSERPDLWPWSARRHDGVLHIGGLPVTDIVREWGSPIYVLDESDLEGRALTWVSAMAEEFWDGYGMGGGSAYFAAKAFMSAGVIRTVTRVGMGVDTASLGELTCALEAGADPDRIGLHGNNKSDEEIRMAVSAGDHGIARIVIDAPAEVDRIAAIAREVGRRARVMIRVTTGVHAGGHDFIATAHEDQKFGLSLVSGAAMEVARAVAVCDELDFVGLHSHIGSQIFDLDAFTESASRLMGFAHELTVDGIECREIDLGGGYAISYTGADSIPPSQKEVARSLATAVREACATHAMTVPHISIEPGRSTIGPTTVTLYRVGTVKRVPIDEGERLYVSVDGGMSDNIRPALYDAKYSVALANRASDGPTALSRIVGKHCESGDIIVSEALLPADVAPGDILAIPATGAYGHSMSSNYNMLTRPGTLAVRDGKAHWLIYPETVSDLLDRDATLNPKKLT